MFSLDIRGWWTRIWVGCIGGYIVYRYVGVGTKAVSDDLSDSPLMSLEQLEKDIETCDTQQRYRQYQSHIRQWVQRTYDIDVKKCTYRTLPKELLPVEIVDLLQETYFYPYNLEVGDHAVMREQMQRFLSLRTHEA